MNVSIRTRSTVYFSTLLGVFLVGFLGILTFAVSASLERDFRSRLNRDADILSELFKEEMRLKALEEFEHEAAELGLTFRVLDESRAVFFQSRMWNQLGLTVDAPAIAAGSTHEWAIVSIDGMPHAILSQPVVADGRRFIMQLAEPKEGLVMTRRTMIWWGGVLIPLMVGAGVAAGVFFSRTALAPIETLRKRADALGADDLSARVPYPPIRDELYFLAETLNRALARIEDGYGRMKSFTADAAHELRIPLTALRGALEVALRRERTPEEYRSALEDALEEAERLSRITSDLLALARADSGERTVNRVSVAVKPFLEKIVSESNEVFGERVFLGSVPEIAASFDADQIQRVLLNLIDNAAKYGGASAKVQLLASESDGQLRFLVKDNGPGIPTEHQARIFDRFYRADKARARAAGSSGLGLSIALAIARAHGGALTLKNSSTSGSEFELSLPLEDSNPTLKRA